MRATEIFAGWKTGL